MKLLMAVEAPGAQECLMGSGFGIQDGSGYFPPQQRMEMLAFPGSHNALAAAASSSPFSCALPLDIVQSLACELERQRVEMDWFLQMENQRLMSWILVEETRQREAVMQKYESRMKTLMLLKDQQLAAARNRARDLQNWLRIKEIEARALQRKAAEKEATARFLRNKLVAAQEQETVSFHDSSSPEQNISKPEEQVRKMVCKLCQARSSCSVFLPCRHLCCCNHCEALLGHCPVCGTAKEASLEVFLG